MKRLVLCFDGTWNSADSRGAETNVAKIARAVRANSGGQEIPQLTLYTRGVGSTGIALQRLVDGVGGVGIDDNILSGYMFWAQNYVPGDEIFIFGFSRGAFTARSLAGFVGSSGLLKRQRLGDVAKAWNYYRTATERSPKGFCSSYGSECHEDVTVNFLGVWDTVGALGIPSSLLGTFVNDDYQFHNTRPSRSVKVARHALAIDEFRDEFVPTLWTGSQPEGSDIRQVWFAGAHSDVGGGYARSALSDIPLHWMAKEAQRAGLDLDWDMLPREETLDPLAPQHESRRSWSRKDRVTPTIRMVNGYEAPVSFYQGLYRAMGDDGKPVAVINESIHESVVKRLGRRVTSLTDDGDEEGFAFEYEPINLAKVRRRAVPRVVAAAAAGAPV